MFFINLNSKTDCKDFTIFSYNETYFLKIICRSRIFPPINLLVVARVTQLLSLYFPIEQSMKCCGSCGLKLHGLKLLVLQFCCWHVLLLNFLDLLACCIVCCCHWYGVNSSPFKFIRPRMIY